MVKAGRPYTSRLETALHSVAERPGNEEAVRLLMKSGASVKRSGGYIHSPLSQTIALRKWGVQNGHSEMMGRRLSQSVGGANGGLHYGEKLLELNVDNGSIDTLELLLDNGVDIKAPNGQKTPMHVIKFGSSEGLIAMIEKGADINTEFEKKDCAVHCGGKWLVEGREEASRERRKRLRRV